MTRSDEDTSFLHSIPYGILKEFRAEACLTVFSHFHSHANPTDL
jgi:hypothetical protein